MNCKVLLPVAALLAVVVPTAAMSRNHHLDGSALSGAGQTGASSLFGAGTSMFNRHGNSSNTSTAGIFHNPLTNGVTQSNGLFNNNNALLNNNGIFKKKKRSWLSRLLSSIGIDFGKFKDGRFNNNGSIFNNSGSGSGISKALRNLLGRAN
jgi:hypothetical protein